jgi:hypothetical protein
VEPPRVHSVSIGKTRNLADRCEHHEAVFLGLINIKRNFTPFEVVHRYMPTLGWGLFVINEDLLCGCRRRKLTVDEKRETRKWQKVMKDFCIYKL